MPTVAELGQRVKAKYPGSYDDMPDDELGRRTKAKFPGAYDDFSDSAGVAPMAMTPQNNPLTAAGNDLRNRLLGMLPGAGGLAGGLVGAAGGIPGAVAGAAVGGAAGEGAREALQGDQFSPVDIGREGALQGGYQAAGGLLAKGAGALAPQVMKRAAGIGRTILKNFPDAAEEMVKRGITVSKGGVAKATSLREESSRKLYEALGRSKAAGTKLRTADVTKPVREVAANPVMPTAERKLILKQMDDFIKQHGDEMDPVLLKQVKQFYQNRAATVYRAEQSGGMTLAQANRGVFSKALAKGAREQLETIPGVAAREAETKGLIGAEKAAEGAFMRPPRPFDVGRPGTYPVASSPRLWSEVAVRLGDPKFQSIARQSPRIAAEMIRQLMHTEEPDATGGGAH